MSILGRTTAKMKQSWLKLARVYVTMTDHRWESFDVLATQIQDWLCCCGMCYQIMNVCVLSHLGRVRLYAMLWTVARQAPLSMGLSRQEYWSGLPCPSPRDLSDPGIKPSSLISPALAGKEGFFLPLTWETLVCITSKPCYSVGGGGLVAKSCLTFVTPWTVACQAPLSMGFSRQEHWSGLLFASPGNLPNPGIEPGCPALQADSLLTELWGKPPVTVYIHLNWNSLCFEETCFGCTNGLSKRLSKTACVGCFQRIWKSQIALLKLKKSEIWVL